MESTAFRRTALVVVDVQVGLFRGATPPLDADGVVARINHLTARARAAEVPVFFMQHDGPAEGNWLVPLTDAWKLLPELGVAPEDRVIRKTTGDSFYRTSLDAELRSRKVTRIVLLGYATEFCIDATLRAATSRDFEVTLVSDAHTTDDSPTLQADQIRNYFNWVWENSCSGGEIQVVPAAQVEFTSPTADPGKR